MSKKLIDILRDLARELIEDGYDADEVMRKISLFDIDFLEVREELLDHEESREIDDAELDTIRVLLAYILMRDSDIEIDEIYAFVFSKGKQIVWN